MLKNIKYICIFAILQFSGTLYGIECISVPGGNVGVEKITRQYSTEPYISVYTYAETDMRKVGSYELPYYRGFKECQLQHRMYRSIAEVRCKLPSQRSGQYAILYRFVYRSSYTNIEIEINYGCREKFEEHSILGYTPWQYMPIAPEGSVETYFLHSPLFIQTDDTINKGSRYLVLDKMNDVREMDASAVAQKMKTALRVNNNPYGPGSGIKQLYGSVSKYYFPFKIHYWDTQRGFGTHWPGVPFPQLVMREVAGNEVCTACEATLVRIKGTPASFHSIWKSTRDMFATNATAAICESNNILTNELSPEDIWHVKIYPGEISELKEYCAIHPDDKRAAEYLFDRYREAAASYAMRSTDAPHRDVFEGLRAHARRCIIQWPENSNTWHRAEVDIMQLLLISSSPTWRDKLREWKAYYATRPQDAYRGEILMQLYAKAAERYSEQNVDAPHRGDIIECIKLYPQFNRMWPNENAVWRRHFIEIIRNISAYKKNTGETLRPLNEWLQKIPNEILLARTVFDAYKKAAEEYAKRSSDAAGKSKINDVRLLFKRCVLQWPQHHDEWLKRYIEVFEIAKIDFYEELILKQFIEQFPQSQFAQQRLKKYQKQKKEITHVATHGVRVVNTPEAITADPTVLSTNEIVEQSNLVSAINPGDRLMCSNANTYFASCNVLFHEASSMIECDKEDAPWKDATFVRALSAENAQRNSLALSLYRLRATSASKCIRDAAGASIVSLLNIEGAENAARSVALSMAQKTPDNPVALHAVMVTAARTGQKKAAARAGLRLWKQLAPYAENLKSKKQWLALAELTKYALPPADAGVPADAVKMPLRMHLYALLQLFLYEEATHTLNAFESSSPEHSYAEIWAQLAFYLSRDMQHVCLQDTPNEWYATALKALEYVNKPTKALYDQHLLAALHADKTRDFMTASYAWYAAENTVSRASWCGEQLLTHAHNTGGHDTRNYAQTAASWLSAALSPGRSPADLFMPPRARPTRPGICTAAAEALRLYKNDEPARALVRYALKYYPASYVLPRIQCSLAFDAGAFDRYTIAQLIKSNYGCMTYDHELFRILDMHYAEQNDTQAQAENLIRWAKCDIAWDSVVVRSGDKYDLSPETQFVLCIKDGYTFRLIEPACFLPEDAREWCAIRSRYSRSDILNGRTHWWRSAQVRAAAMTRLATAAQLMKIEIDMNGAQALINGSSLSVRDAYADILEKCFYDAQKTGLLQNQDYKNILDYINNAVPLSARLQGEFNRRWDWRRIDATRDELHQKMSERNARARRAKRERDELMGILPLPGPVEDILMIPPLYRDWFLPPHVLNDMQNTTSAAAPIISPARTYQKGNSVDWSVQSSGGFFTYAPISACNTTAQWQYCSEEGIFNAPSGSISINIAHLTNTLKLITPVHICFTPRILTALPDTWIGESLSLFWQPASTTTAHVRVSARSMRRENTMTYNAHGELLSTFYMPLTNDIKWQLAPDAIELTVASGVVKRITHLLTPAEWDNAVYTRAICSTQMLKNVSIPPHIYSEE